MSQNTDRSSSLIAILIAAMMFVVAGAVGGPHYWRDVAAIESLALVRTTRGLTMPAIWITQVGGALGMIVILLAATGMLAIRRRWHDALSLIGIVLGGRLVVEVLKIVINRPRPNFGPYPVEIASLSFPSGHSANSMITFLALALIAAPARYRLWAVALAVLASVLVGATRPLLGVHWPTDVIGGWSFGIAWVVALVALTDRWRRAAK